MSGAGEQLLEELGEEIVERHAPLQVNGQVDGHVDANLDGQLEAESVDVSLRPRDGDELARCLRVLSEKKLSVSVRGRGTRSGLGNPTRSVAAVLGTEKLSGIVEFDRQDGVLQAAAGTTLREVAETVREAGWELPLDPPGETTTVGGAIATAATGPRRQHFGAPRRSILGLQVVLAPGERTSCGGRVVKNVTGYDMAKLYSGSLGTLGVIESAWLRLRPAPAATRTLVAVFAAEASSRAFAVGLAASRRSSVRAAALVSGAPAADLGAPTGGDVASALVVECAGDEAAVEKDADWLASETAARSVSEEARLLGRLRELQGGGRLRARLAVLPTQLEAAVAPLARAGVGTIVYPGAGMIYALSEDDGAIAVVDEVARATGADLLFERLPQSLRASRDAFGDPGGLAKLLRAVKQRFDPDGILNPGRGQGRL